MTDAIEYKALDGTLPGMPNARGMPSIVKAIMLDATGVASSPTTKRQYTLLTNQNALTPAGQAGQGPMDGGDYVWRTEAANWNGATATLQFLGLDGVTWYPVRNAANTADVAMTANGSIGVGIAQGSFLRVNVTGTAPSGMNSAVGGL